MGWTAGVTVAAAVLLAACGDARAAMGMTQIPASEELGPATVYYPSSSPSRPSGPAAWQLDVAADGVPVRGNGRLVLISHGTGASTWPYADQARALDLPTGGHGAYLSPLPPVFDGVLGEMMNDPPGFDRARELPPVHARVAAFFVRHLLR